MCSTTSSACVPIEPVEPRMMRRRFMGATARPRAVPCGATARPEDGSWAPYLLRLGLAVHLAGHELAAAGPVEGSGTGGLRLGRGGRWSGTLLLLRLAVLLVAAMPAVRMTAAPAALATLVPAVLTLLLAALLLPLLLTVAAPPAPATPPAPPAAALALVALRSVLILRMRVGLDRRRILWLGEGT